MPPGGFCDCILARQGVLYYGFWPTDLSRKKIAALCGERIKGEPLMSEKLNIPEMYGSYLFGDKEMRARLP
ncbi:MAG: hypothetical protein SO155_11210, partial [Candidatus Ventricola sp.]|nr:hypothetical protein [Candidatus Ventricola sp.]